MIRDRFTQTRESVIELNEIQALIWSNGDDWQPDTPKSPNASDPTALRACYNVDIWQDRLNDLRKRESQLIDFIGVTLELIEGVRDGLGDEYASILEQRYIDCYTWSEVTYNGSKVARSTGKRKVSIAFDWIDSLGVTNVLAGYYEI